jgi:hypothetical protein
MYMVCSLHQQSHPKVPLTSLSLTRLRVTHNYPSRPSSDTEETERPRREEVKWTKALLGWLNFAELEDRQRQVKVAHQETFDWIFEPGNETGFAEWLKSGSGIYWINGKPAAGKSI